MAITSHLFLCLVALASFLAPTESARGSAPPFNRTSFPAGFVFGSGSAAYQCEGAAQIDGRGPSIWDNFTHEHPEKIADRSTGDVAVDMYHRYKEDIILMKSIGLEAFRFSISWSRLFPKGKISGGVNKLGVRYYNNLINELLAAGQTPYVTLFHWDLPNALEDAYSGFLSESVVDDYRDYVDFCFKTFGDRVKHWFTLNEPFTFSFNGYARGTMAPGRCSDYVGNCTGGNSATEPYIVSHNLILCHAAAVELYRVKYKPIQKGEIGVTLVINWYVPYSQSITDRRAAQRAVDFMLGWFLHPMTFGDYPRSMKAFVGNRLPRFTAKQSRSLQNSYDFLGINYYTSNFAANGKPVNGLNQSYITDSQTILSTERNGKPIGTPTALDWLFVYPRGIYDLMIYLKSNYKNPPIFITENGLADPNNSSLSVEESLKDKLRIVYHYGHLNYLAKSIREGVNVKGYFIWTFLDDFEWDAGFTVRFGIIYIDFVNGLKRYQKYSSYWFKNFLNV